jgi:hypothetical protein
VAIAVYAYAASRPNYPPDTGLRVEPFSVRSPEPAVSDLRDAIQDMIAARLMATELGAGQVLHGEVGGTPERLSIEVVLGRARARVQGNADSLPYLTDRLAARLLAIQAARDSEELAALTATSLPVLRAYLAGLHAYRRGRGGSPSEAQEDFERAIFLDSTFALANLRLAELAWWAMAELDGRWKLDAIWRRRDRLGPADRALLVAYLGPRYPRTSTLAERITASEQAARAAPHRLEAWRIAGRSLFLLGRSIGYPEWEARSAEALRRALALDSTDEPTLTLLVRLAAGAGDSAAVRRYAGLFLAHNPTAYQAEAIQWVAGIARGGSADLAPMHRYSLRALVEWSPTIGLGLEDADRAAQRYAAGASSVDERRAVVVALVPFLLNRGRPTAASRLLATAERGFGQRADVGVLEFRIYAALYWDGDSSDAATAARSLETYVAGTPAQLGYVRDPQTANCALAHWRFAQGDLVGAEAALQRMSQRRAAADSFEVASTPVCAAAAAAQLAAARRRPDAGVALARLDTLLAAGSEARHLLPAVASLIAARLHEARGDLHQAIAYSRRRTIWVNQLLSTQLREEGRLAALVGDLPEAIRAYRHYLAVRSVPEAVLQPETERVRVELARLERLSPLP